MKRAVRNRACLLPLLLYAGLSSEAQRACFAGTPPEQLSSRVTALLAQMTPEEKIAQLQDNAPSIPRLHLPAYNWWNEGLHGVARNGFATVFPQAIGMAATWDPELMTAIGDVVATEARARYDARFGQDAERYAGLTLWSPNINIFRDPRWGRGQETYGEDPYLTGLLATHFVQGVQGSDPFYLRADATPKHFAVHSGPERTRDGFDSVASQHDLADTYLPAFRTVLTVGHAAAMMCSYNRINGIPSCANAALLNGRVREQWGFNGYIVSDCDAVSNITHYHHWTSDDEHGAAAALKAGTDLNCGSTYKALSGALAQRLIVESDLDISLFRLLMARVHLGMLDAQECGPYGHVPLSEIASPSHHALALRAAEESIVLLRNDGLLPLSPNRKVAVIGPTADILENLEGNYHGTAVAPVTLLEGIRASFTQVSYAQGSTLVAGTTLTVPRTALRASEAPDAAQGLTAQYYTNTDFSGVPAATRMDTRMSFDFDRAPPLAMLSGHGSSVRWQGMFLPPGAGTYKLRVHMTRCDDCSAHDSYKLFLGNKLVLAGSGLEAHQKDFVVVDIAGTAPQPVRLELQHRGDEGLALEWEPPANILLEEALAVAAKSEVVFAIVGLSPNLEGEALDLASPGFDGGDRTSLALPAAQSTLLSRLAELDKPLVVILSSGSAVSLGTMLPRTASILAAWYGGEAAGTALGEILSGTVSPSGRLPVTFYRSIADLPPFSDYSMAHRTYRYYDGPVEFRFGDGLSYARFSYTAFTLEHPTLTAGDKQVARVTIRNTSLVKGAEIAQLYLAPPSLPGSPQLALAGTERVTLRAGEAREISFTLDSRQLSFVDEQGERAVRPGGYTLFVGGRQPAQHALRAPGSGLQQEGRPLQASFRIEGQISVEP